MVGGPANGTVDMIADANGQVPTPLDMPILIESGDTAPFIGWSIAVPSDNELIEKTTAIERSNQIVEQPFYDTDGSLLGSVELSNGPAYGRNIMRSVAWGWAIAATLAVLLAAAAGWLVSRRFSDPLQALTRATSQMAAGDLSARANLSRQDEFGSLARSFNQMADTLEVKIETLRRFVADAAHEIHTPLTALRANLELGENRQALQQVERMDALTRSLLDLSRLESGERIEFSDVNLSDLLQNLAEPYASRAEQAGVIFELEIGADPIMVRGNATQLGTLIHNLLDNAIKFTPAGGRVLAQLNQQNEKVELIVSDTGIGIPEEDLPQLFSRFHRGRNVAAYSGSGLGLAIVKAITEQHKANITVESDQNGTKFLVSFCASV